ncbi:MAG: sulfotransferase [Phenylobacterium sp.]|uniref:tetratricopeptide repeat-containing sulfotransferase family protein n=1 Tax=Phenylobacterium sp. TaxID=1871053 RepID=UPI001A4DFC29|nr:tetratricopeptide repeat-containing sulfotransferase family protein [Phenylobacterium sp.]MBL8771595.1 sulfotransferase [Phenylobacterium sp.]
MSNWTSGRFTVRVGGVPAPAAPPAPVADAGAAARHRAEGDRLRLAGDIKGADAAYAREMRATVSDPDLVRAADALVAGRYAEADAVLRARLAARPRDAHALWMLGDLCSRAGRNGEAEDLLARCVALAPDLTSARYAYAMVLNWRNKVEACLAQAERLLAIAPENPVYRHLKASSLLRLGDDAGAAAAYAAVLDAEPDQPLTLMSYGHVLKTIGRQGEAVAAYRRALALDPGLGEAWWSLANLKTVRFAPEDVAAMEATLGRELSVPDRLQLHFALGKAHEDAGRYEAAFAHYEAGNALQRPRVDYAADETTAQMRRTKALMGQAFFAARAGQGSRRPDPIFIVGLPRSGSTLVEQILASHSQVEGTHELPHLPNIAAQLAGPARREIEGAYPDVLAALSPAELSGLGEDYLARAQIHRKLARPRFIDKLPNNWAHVGLIQLILPNARIIDARRHPLGCCFSAYKQHFAVGQAFSYDQADLGRYYRDYVELMAHFDAVLPGRVHRVIYERMVADPEAEVRRLLDYCGLPFEPACLRFYENDRAVRTASSEQVRQPIFTDAAEHWRHFETWLGPLKGALGAVLDAYPEAPAPPQRP